MKKKFAILCFTRATTSRIFVQIQFRRYFPPEKWWNERSGSQRNRLQCRKKGFLTFSFSSLLLFSIIWRRWWKTQHQNVVQLTSEWSFFRWTKREWVKGVNMKITNFQFLRLFLPFIHSVFSVWKLSLESTVFFGVDSWYSWFVNWNWLHNDRKNWTRKGTKLNTRVEKIWKCFLDSWCSQQWSTVWPPCLFKLNFPFSQNRFAVFINWKKENLLIFYTHIWVLANSRRHKTHSCMLECNRKCIAFFRSLTLAYTNELNWIRNTEKWDDRIMNFWTAATSAVEASTNVNSLSKQQNSVSNFSTFINETFSARNCFHCDSKWKNWNFYEISSFFSSLPSIGGKLENIVYTI